jgi:hypothetical protein
MDFFIYMQPDSGIGERYFTGNFTRLGSPDTTDFLPVAVGFPTARAAYDYAGKEAMFCRALLNFHVGRRPDPINLRSLLS